MANHPILPNHRPLAIAHRSGNSIATAREAAASGFDMIETDVWPFWGKLQVRHAKSIGPIPIYWEKWYIESFFGHQLELHELVQGLPPNTPLFLDLKGTQSKLGQNVVRAVEKIQQDRQIILCGRAWSQLDPVETLRNVHVFYSVGDENQLEQVWDRIAAQQNPAVSINHGLLNEETMARFNQHNTTVIAWTVNDPGTAHALFDLGVDGFTSDNQEMLNRIVELRERAFDTFAKSDLPDDPEPEGED
jgi:glycerophosphoryl diester phosphodiesterase